MITAYCSEIAEGTHWLNQESGGPLVSPKESVNYVAMRLGTSRGPKAPHQMQQRIVIDVAVKVT